MRNCNDKYTVISNHVKKKIDWPFPLLGKQNRYIYAGIHKKVLLCFDTLFMTPVVRRKKIYLVIWVELQLRSYNCKSLNILATGKVTLSQVYMSSPNNLTYLQHISMPHPSPTCAAMHCMDYIAPIEGSMKWRIDFTILPKWTKCCWVTLSRFIKWSRLLFLTPSGSRFIWFLWCGGFHVTLSWKLICHLCSFVIGSQ